MRPNDRLGSMLLKKDFEGGSPSNIDSRRAPNEQVQSKKTASMIRLLPAAGMPRTFSTASVICRCYRTATLPAASPQSTDITDPVRPEALAAGDILVLDDLRRAQFSTMLTGKRLLNRRLFLAHVPLSRLFGEGVRWRLVFLAFSYSSSLADAFPYGRDMMRLFCQTLSLSD
jgi:hypothetical protein